MRAHGCLHLSFGPSPVAIHDGNIDQYHCDDYHEDEGARDAVDRQVRLDLSDGVGGVDAQGVLADLGRVQEAGTDCVEDLKLLELAPVGPVVDDDGRVKATAILLPVNYLLIYH